jgi:hypothetical protein
MQATSTIQGTMDANLNSNGGFNPSQVSEYLVWPLYGVNSLPLINFPIDLQIRCKPNFFHVQLYAGAEAKQNTEVIGL